MKYFSNLEINFTIKIITKKLIIKRNIIISMML